MDITYTIEFFSYWHCGSGLSAGADVDSLVIKDAKGMPFVPGKTIKGLIREAAETLNNLAPDRYPSQEIIDNIFGKRSETAEIPQIGKAFFSNAEFPATDYDAFNYLCFKTCRFGTLFGKFHYARLVSMFVVRVVAMAFVIVCIMRMPLMVVRVAFCLVVMSFMVMGVTIVVVSFVVMTCMSLCVLVVMRF